MTLDHFIAYFLIVFIATVTPGPSMLLAINHGVNHGLVRTLYSGLGNLLGNLLLALASVMGLGAILLASGIVFNVIKWIGIFYLVFIGIKMIFEPTGTSNPDEEEKKALPGKKRRSLFIDGFVIAIGNPKGILFFTALFPQFIDVGHVTITSFVIIFITLSIIAFGCYMLYGIFGMRLNNLLKSGHFKKIFNRISGSILIGTGVLLAFTKK
jgi:homoserine/homoserine lactone efflux protein